MSWSPDATGLAGYWYRLFHVPKAFCCLGHRVSLQEPPPTLRHKQGGFGSNQQQPIPLSDTSAGCIHIEMLPNLVGVRLVSEGGEVLRDWALHFKPSSGGSLAEFFEEIATGGNDSGDGFVLPTAYDSVRVKARVSDAKGGQEMTIPASAAFQDATGFGQWFTFHVPPRQEARDKVKERDAPRTGIQMDRTLGQERSGGAWRTTMTTQTAAAAMAPSVRSVQAAAATAQYSYQSVSEDTVQEPAHGTGSDVQSESTQITVPALEPRGTSGNKFSRVQASYSAQECSDDEGTTSEDSTSTSDSDLQCNTHKTTNLDEEEEASNESPVDTSQDALSSVHESFMQLMHKLLRAMPSTPQSARLLQCANPPNTPSGRNHECNGDHQDLPGPCTVCNPDDVGVWTYNISQLVFDYITTVMFDEGIMLDVDYNAWEGVLLVVEHNATACKVALSKLSDAPNTAGKCLMGESQSACKDFAYLFCKAVIRHSHVTHKLITKDVESSPVHKLGSGLLSMFDTAGDSGSFDVVPLFDVVCSCVLVTLQLGYKHLWTRAVLALSKVSSNLAANAWGGQGVQVLKLETINKIFARLLREGLVHQKSTSGAPYELPSDMREAFASYGFLAKGFVHPLMLVKDEFVEFVQAYIWDCDTTTFQVLMALEEFLSDENTFAGHDFEQISNSIHKIVSIDDKFKTHRMVYWLFRPEEKKAGIWHMAFGRYGRQHRWRLLYLLMRLSDCGGETRENFMKMPNWSRLVGWMLKDGAGDGGTIPGDPGIDKGAILEWARQFDQSTDYAQSSVSKSAGVSVHGSAHSSGRSSGYRHSRQSSVDNL